MALKEWIIKNKETEETEILRTHDTISKEEVQRQLDLALIQSGIENPDKFEIVGENDL